MFVLFFFKIEDGEMIGLLGLFGFGKIILLCIIAGLEGVDFGMIYFWNCDVMNVYVCDCWVGFVF